MFRRKEKGFTLIELLIVIAVIGVLAAAILPRFIDFSTDAAIGATKGALSSLRAALAIYVSKNDGVFPTPNELGTNVKSALVTDYIDMIPPEQVAALGATKEAEETTIYSYYETSGGWVYEGSATSARFYINESTASAW